MFKGEKIREVYNASARTRGRKSLNDHMFRGPLKLPDLAGMLMRFRMSKFPLFADIEKAFLQIELEEPDREVTKFLWLKDINKLLTSDNLTVYRFTRVAFGVICSPSLLAMTIEHHLSKYPGKENLFKNIYVDNVFVDCDSEEEVYEKYIELKRIFSEGKMNLREFVSNARNTLNKIPVNDRLRDMNQKILGIQRDIKEDRLELKFPSSNQGTKITRRKVLEAMASLFDPLGLASPCLVNPKLLFQKLWDKPKNWDEELEIDHLSEWKNILKTWENQDIIISRIVSRKEKTIKYQLHVFVDANKNTYAAVVYLRSEEKDNFKVSLVYARNRIKSKKQNLTIPRIELLALLIGTRALKFVENELELEIEKKIVWSDAKVVLLWINSKEKQPRFIENRLLEIRKNTDFIFKYVSTNENPADVCTRGCTPEELKLNTLWWNGPTWMKNNEDKWPNELEIKIEQIFQETPITLIPKTLFIKLVKIERFNTWKKLVKVTSLVLRFLKIKLARILINDKWKNKFLLLRNENYGQNTENILIKLAQNEKIKEFGKWIIFEDELGIKRLKSRIEHSEANTDLENPIIIPKNSDILLLIIKDIHERFKHSRVQNTLVEFLSQFWTPQARRKVKEVLNRCLKCKRMKSYSFMLPKFPNLPDERIQRTSPFKSIGIDHLGPSMFKENDNQEKKFWITLITCLCTRAVYLEPVKNLRADTCLNILKRFASRRGCPEKILSDNSKTFIACAKSCKVHLKLIKKDLEWKVIKELSPWQGGVYERIVALVKDAFRKTLGKRTLKWEEIITFTIEVEGILNMRPLTAIEENPDIPGIIPLRPVDFLYPKRNLCLEIEIPTLTDPKIDFKINFKESFIYTEFLLNELWKRWKKEYLIWLRDKSQWTMKGPRLQTKREPIVGEIVILEEEFVPRNMWKLAKIVELQDTKDGRCVRNVKILIPNGSIISRPINKLYPLELNIENKEIENRKDNNISLEESLENKKNPSKEITKKITKTLSTVVTTLFIFCLILIMFCLVIAKPQCNDCLVECNDKGILISSSEQIDKYEICCSEGPCTTHPRVDQFQYEIDKEILVTHHHCEVNFWSKTKNLLKYEVKCEPSDPCKLIPCYFCLERMINHTCSPFISIFLIALLIIIMTISCSIFYCLFRSVFKLFKFCFPRSITNRKIKKSPKKWIMKKRLLVMIIFLNISYAEIMSRTALTESCFRKNGKIDCSWNFVETLTMMDNKVKQTIVLKDTKNKILGQINLTPEGFNMRCEPIIEKYLRSYEVKIQTVKSCPGTGSCHHDNCLIVNNNWEQNIKELEPWKNYTGYNRCSASCSFLWCKYGMTTGMSCLFYRIYTEPTDSDIYEIFTCRWIPIFNFKMETIFIGSETNEKNESRITMQPGTTVHGSNITMAITQFSSPPEPEMNGKFIGNKKFISLTDEIYSNVYCKCYKAAEKFECEIKEEICQECLPDHDKVDCKCKNLELESLILNTQRILPIKTQTLDLNFDGEYVFSEIYDMPVDVIIKVNNLRLVTLDDWNKCEVKIYEFGGCYNCRTGADLNFTCKTDSGIALAEINCNDDISFSTKCTEKGENKIQRLNFNHANIDLNCKVECLGGNTDLKIRGTLFLINILEFENNRHVISSNSRVNEKGKNESKWNYFKEILKNLFKLDLMDFVLQLKNLILIGILLICFLFTGILIKLKLVFRLYRYLLKLIFIIYVFTLFEGGGAHKALKLVLYDRENILEYNNYELVQVKRNCDYLKHEYRMKNERLTQKVLSSNLGATHSYWLKMSEYRLFPLKTKIHSIDKGNVELNLASSFTKIIKCTYFSESLAKKDIQKGKFLGKTIRMKEKRIDSPLKAYTYSLLYKEMLYKYLYIFCYFLSCFSIFAIFTFFIFSMLLKVFKIFLEIIFNFIKEMPPKKAPVKDIRMDSSEENGDSDVSFASNSTEISKEAIQKRAIEEKEIEKQRNKGMEEKEIENQKKCKLDDHKEMISYKIPRKQIPLSEEVFFNSPVKVFTTVKTGEKSLTIIKEKNY